MNFREFPCFPLCFPGGPERPLRGGRVGCRLPRGLHDHAATRRRGGAAGAAGSPVAGRRREVFMDFFGFHGILLGIYSVFMDFNGICRVVTLW